MRIKRYQAGSVHEALALVRRELGPDAVIIATRKVPGGVEVSAAMDYDAPLANGQGAQSAAIPGNNQAAEPGLGELRQELAALRQAIAGAGMLREGTPERAALYGWLTGRGLDRDTALEVISALEAEGKTPAVPPQGPELIGLAEAIGSLVPVGGFGAKFGAKLGATSRSGQRVFAFVGPTGVGKTTAVAKLAARLTLKRKYRVGIISCDTYRVGAPEQIRSFARLLQVPLNICEPGRELSAALERQKECGVVLIDTPGCSPRDRERLGELARLAALPVESHLVLSATTRDEELAAAVAGFGAVGFESVIFTKLDEAERLGVIINTARRARRPVSWLGTGQRVPGGLEPASPERVAQFVLHP